MRALIFLLLIGCSDGGGGSPYANNYFSDVTHYNVNFTRLTRQGIRVDGDLDLVSIDRRTDEVEACLMGMYPNGQLPAAVVAASFCATSDFNPQIQREWIGVKLAPDWYRGCYDENRKYVGAGHGEEKFPADVDPALCEAKGLKVTKECPCGERAAIQGNSTIVTAPNMHLYKSELIRLVTGCNNIWASPLASCYAAK